MYTEGEKKNYKKYIVFLKFQESVIAQRYIRETIVGVNVLLDIQCVYWTAEPYGAYSMQRKPLIEALKVTGLYHEYYVL